MIYDVVIIGGASAGLTSGIFAGRKKLNAVILSKEVGGQSLLTNTIENFPGFDSISGREIITKMRAQVEKFGVEIKEGVEVKSIEKSGDVFSVNVKNGDKVEAKSVILATGKNPRRLGIPGEKEFENKGVSFCSICDAPLYGGKVVAVVGSGNSGLESARDLVKYAEKIYVMEYGPEIKGDESTQEIKGGTLVEKIIYKDKKTGEAKELAVGGVFVNIGWIPATGFLKDFVKLNEWGEVVIDHNTTETSVEGVFAAGDLTDIKYKQCVTATGEGAKAALAAYDFIASKN